MTEEFKSAKDSNPAYSIYLLKRLELKSLGVKPKDVQYLADKVNQYYNEILDRLLNSMCSIFLFTFGEDSMGQHVPINLIFYPNYIVKVILVKTDQRIMIAVDSLIKFLEKRV